MPEISTKARRAVKKLTLIWDQDENVPGLPRPLASHEDDEGHLTAKPVPWSQSGTNWGVIDSKRKYNCMDHSNCLVCGELVKEGFALWNLYDKNQNAWFDPIDKVSFIDLNNQRVGDNGPMHDRCLKITRAHCQAVRKDIANGHVIVVPYTFDKA